MENTTKIVIWVGVAAVLITGGVIAYVQIKKAKEKNSEKEAKEALKKVQDQLSAGNPEVAKQVYPIINGSTGAVVSELQKDFGTKESGTWSQGDFDAYKKVTGKAVTSITEAMYKNYLTAYK